MKKSYAIIVIVAIVALALLYNQGYFDSGVDSVTTPASLDLDDGWTAVTIPSTWPATTASELCAANPIIGMMSYYSTDHWVSYIPGTATADFSITPGMEVKIWTNDGGTVFCPGS